MSPGHMQVHVEVTQNVWGYWLVEWGTGAVLRGTWGQMGGMGGTWEIPRGYVGVQLTGWKTDCSPLPPSQSFPRTPTLQPVLEITL